MGLKAMNVDLAASFLDMEILWEGKGAEAEGVDQNGNVIVTVDIRDCRSARRGRCKGMQARR